MCTGILLSFLVNEALNGGVIDMRVHRIIVNIRGLPALGNLLFKVKVRSNSVRDFDVKGSSFLFALAIHSSCLTDILLWISKINIEYTNKRFFLK